jgi:MFS family permease
MADFGLSFTRAGALATAFFVVSGVGQSLAGFAVDRFGARRALFAGSPPAGGVWNEPGAVWLAGPAGRLPIGVLEAELVYGASRLTEVADMAVFLGPATRLVDQEGS